MFDRSRFQTGSVVLQPDDLLAIYSDGITEAENPKGVPFDEQGLETVLRGERRNNVAATCAAVVRAVERHRADTRLADDLTLLLLRRSTVPSTAGV
jgi:sigma-B regulation protein RsbU (phosphoserine phosphatase)